MRPVTPADDWLRMTGIAATADGWTLTLMVEGRQLEVGCGDGRWQRSSVDVGDGRQLVVETIWPLVQD